MCRAVLRRSRRRRRLVGDVPGRAAGLPRATRRRERARRGWSRSPTARPSTSPAPRRAGPSRWPRRPTEPGRRPGPPTTARSTSTAAAGARCAALPAKQRQAVAYHYLAGLPYAEVAAIVGGSADAARRAAADGIAALRARDLDATTDRKRRPDERTDTTADLTRRPGRDLPGHRRATAASCTSAWSPRAATAASSTSPTARSTRRRAAAAGRHRRRTGPHRLRRRGPRRRAGDAGRAVSPRILRAPARLDRAAAELDEYFGGRRRRFDLPLDWRLSQGFRLGVLRRLVDDVGYGRTATYGRLAELAGNARAVRAVGSACATNPAPGRGALPPGGAHATADGRVPRRARRQAAPARPRAGGMSRASARRRARRLRPGPRPGRTGSTPRDWDRVGAELDECGGAPVGQLLDPQETDRLAGSTTTTTGSAPRSTWPATATARAATATSPTRCPTRCTGCAGAFYPRLLPVARDWWAELGRSRRGRTTSTSGWIGATGPGRTGPRRCCCATRRVAGTRCTGTSTASWCSRCRSSINLTRPGVDHTGGEFVLVEQRPAPSHGPPS